MTQSSSAARRPRRPKCLRPWCGVGGKFCIDCAPLQPRVPLEDLLERYGVEEPNPKRLGVLVHRLSDWLHLLAQFDAGPGDVVTWVLGLHRPGDLHPELCHLDGKDWPCPEHDRLTASIATRRERLGLTDPKVSAPTSTTSP